MHNMAQCNERLNYQLELKETAEYLYSIADRPISLSEFDEIRGGIDPEELINEVFGF